MTKIRDGFVLSSGEDDLVFIGVVHPTVTKTLFDSRATSAWAAGRESWASSSKEVSGKAR